MTAAPAADLPLAEIDPHPQVIPAAEWDRVAAGLCQRVRALDRFVTDVYRRQSIVRDGVVPAAAVGSAAYFEPLMQQAAHDERRFVTIAGPGLLRTPDGFRVIEDRVRTPTGIAQALAAREAVGAQDPRPARHDAALAFLRRAIYAAAPAGVGDPVVAMLVDDAPGFEEVALAERLGLPSVRLGDLSRRGPCLFAHIDGRDIRLDVVYRRTYEDRLQHPRGGLTDVGRLLLEPWAKGRLGLANAFGTGVADDKLLHAYVEDMIRYYLAEAPLLPSVRTWDLFAPGQLHRALAQLESVVVKPRRGPGTVVGPLATPAQLDRAAHALRTSPTEYVVQDFVPLETPFVDLRPFVFYDGRETIALPGGLTRAGATIRDTWIV